MSMTKLERGTRAALARYLREQGYVTYAGILLSLDLNFHRPPRPFVAALLPDKNVIQINPNLTDKESLSTVIRHEILHHYLAHQERALKHYAKQRGLSWSKLENIPLEDLVFMNENDFAKLADSLGDKKQQALDDRKIARGLYGSPNIMGNPYHNVVKDAEISNRGYTEADKEIVKNLQIDGMPFPGIVTDQDFPYWADMSLEEMMDDVEEKLEKEKKLAEKMKGFVMGMFDAADGTFVDIFNHTVYGR